MKTSISHPDGPVVRVGDRSFSRKLHLRVRRPSPWAVLLWPGSPGHIFWPLSVSVSMDELWYLPKVLTIIGGAMFGKKYPYGCRRGLSHLSIQVSRQDCTEHKIMTARLALGVVHDANSFLEDWLADSTWVFLADTGARV